MFDTHGWQVANPIDSFSIPLPLPKELSLTLDTYGVVRAQLLARYATINRALDRTLPPYQRISIKGHRDPVPGGDSDEVVTVRSKLRLHMRYLRRGNSECQRQIRSKPHL